MNNNDIQDIPEKPKFPETLTVVSRLSSTDEDILNALYGKELYGLLILDAFNESGARTISVSTLYPILGRKWYKITQSGLHALSESQRYRNELNQWRPSYGFAINS
jgi:PadR family transcriptional regulator, regulatory protein PadR